MKGEEGGKGGEVSLTCEIPVTPTAEFQVYYLLINSLPALRSPEHSGSPRYP